MKFLYAKECGANERRELVSIVKQRADKLLILEEEGKLPLGTGRKSLVLEMQTFPEQLGLDIKRSSAILIGRKVIPNTMIQKRSPREVFLLLAHNLEKYVKNLSLSLKNEGVPGRLGEFWTAEVIYSIAQNFSAPPVDMVNKNIGAIAKKKWGSPMGETSIKVSFEILPRSVLDRIFSHAILEVSVKTEKKMHNLIKESLPHRDLATEVKIHFDLKNSTVTYNYSYKFGDQQKSWSEHRFFVLS